MSLLHCRQQISPAGVNLAGVPKLRPKATDRSTRREFSKGQPAVGWLVDRRQPASTGDVDDRKVEAALLAVPQHRYRNGLANLNAPQLVGQIR